MYGCVYFIRNKLNGHIYVGQTIREPKHRWLCHQYDLKRNDHCNTHLQSAWNKYGEDSFEFLVQEFAIDQSHLNSLEKIYVTWDGYYNKVEGGSTSSELSEESRNKIREKQMGEKNSMFGRKHSDESKQKISASMKGKVPWNKGSRHTAETKQKISKGLKRYYKGSVTHNGAYDCTTITLKY